MTFYCFCSMNFLSRRQHICHKGHTHHSDEEVKECHKQERKYVYKNGYIFFLISMVKGYKISEYMYLTFFRIIKEAKIYNNNQKLSLDSGQVFCRILVITI